MAIGLSFMVATNTSCHMDERNPLRCAVYHPSLFDVPAATLGPSRLAAVLPDQVIARYLGGHSFVLVVSTDYISKRSAAAGS